MINKGFLDIKSWIYKYIIWYKNNDLYIYIDIFV